MKITTKAIYNNKNELLYEEGYEEDLSVENIALCGASKTPSPQQMVAAPTPMPEPVQRMQTKSITESASSARKNQQEKALKAKGIKSTMLTDSTANNKKSTLLTQNMLAENQVDSQADSQVMNKKKSLLGQ